MEHLLARSASLIGFKTLVAELGGRWQELLFQAQLPIDCLDDNDHLISANKMANLLELSASELNCPDFGIRLAQQQSILMLGSVGMLLQQAKTLGEALTELKSLLYVHSQAGKVEVEQIGSLCNVQFIPLVHDVIGTTQLIHLSLSVGLQMMQAMVAESLTPKAVHLVITEKQSTSLYTKVFGENLLLKQQQDCIVLHQQQLNLPVIPNNKLTKSWMSQWVYQQAHAQSLPLEARVREGIRHLLPSGKPSLVQVSGYLDIEPRTLQRRLNEKQMSFQKLLDDERFVLAKRYFKTTQLSILAVSETLGFESQSSFSRTFKKWTSLSPQNYIRKHELRDLLR